MVTPQAFNALLKIVEEPPEHLIFVFATTEPEKVLSTIRSRTHHYPFRLLAPKTMRGLLERICAEEHVVVDETVYPLVIRAGGGSPRDTLSVLDQLLAGADENRVTYPTRTVPAGRHRPRTHRRRRRRAGRRGCRGAVRCGRSRHRRRPRSTPLRARTCSSGSATSSSSRRCPTQRRAASSTHPPTCWTGCVIRRPDSALPRSRASQRWCTRGSVRCAAPPHRACYSKWCARDYCCRRPATRNPLCCNGSSASRRGWRWVPHPTVPGARGRPPPRSSSTYERPGPPRRRPPHHLRPQARGRGPHHPRRGATTRGRAYATARTQTRCSTPSVGARAGAEARIPARAALAPKPVAAEPPIWHQCQRRRPPADTVTSPTPTPAAADPVAASRCRGHSQTVDDRHGQGARTQSHALGDARRGHGQRRRRHHAGAVARIGQPCQTPWRATQSGRHPGRPA